MSPDFKFQFVLLLKLCTAVVEHGNESPEANEIREAMDDGSWYRLSDQEQEELRSLSAEIDDVETRVRLRAT